MCISGQIAAVALDSNHRRACIEQSAGQPAGPRADFVYLLTGEGAGNRRHAREQLPVENEILSQRLAGAKPMARNDVPERFGRSAHAVWARRAALWAAIRIAAAIGRGSARSWPAISNAVP